MPSPLTHFAAGLAVPHFAARRGESVRRRWKLTALCLFFSFAPDLDVIVGVARGDMGAYHNQITHSLFFGLAACLLVLPLLKWAYREISTIRLFALSYGCYALHLILDWMTYGRGVKLFWPITDARFSSPWIPFYGVRWGDGLFSMRHWITIGNEVMILGVLATIVYMVRTIWLLLRGRKARLSS